MRIITDNKNNNNINNSENINNNNNGNNKYYIIIIIMNLVSKWCDLTIKNVPLLRQYPSYNTVTYRPTSAPHQWLHDSEKTYFYDSCKKFGVIELNNIMSRAL